MEPIHLIGAPHKLDAFLATPLRLTAGALGLALSALLFWVGWRWSAPLPLAFALIAAEVVLELRKRQTVTLTLGEHLHLRDRLGEMELVVRPAEVSAASILAHQMGDLVRLQVLLSAPEQALIALELQVRTEHYQAAATDVPVDFLHLLVGVGGTSLLGLAPARAIARQTLYDPLGDGLSWLRTAVPAEAWETTAVRLWFGGPPPLDLRGFLPWSPTHRLTLEGREVTLSGAAGAFTFPLGGPSAGWSLREVSLRDPATGEEEVGELPLLTLGLHETLTVLAPCLLPWPEALPERGPSGHHLHHGEGMLLLWHLLTRLEPREWPAGLQRNVQESTIHRPLPAALHHLSPPETP
ncbi:MAG: hypothetical protein JXX28_19210 [Deltaproteobacteria bacterium]|nr:hypothetical protein [Deltaproteobacteria bacterium]